MFKNGYGHKTQLELKKIRNEGELNPVEFCFQSWNDYDLGKHLMTSRGTFILLGGEPHHGKTYVTNELVMQLIEKHNFKVALFSTESGGLAKIFSIFYGMYIGKPYSKLKPNQKENPYSMNDDERDIAESFINQHLWVFEQDRKTPDYQNIENIYKLVEETEKAEDIKFDCVVIDPIYDVDDFKPNAEEVKRVLSYIDYQCEVNNRTDIVVNHVSDTAKFVNKEGKRFKLRALGDEFYGGKNNQRKAKIQILIERAIPNLTPEDPADFVPENQTNVVVLKAKPEGVAFIGTYPIFYDWKKRRFYENYNDKKQFAYCTRFFSDEVTEVNTKSVPLGTPEKAFEIVNYYERESKDDLPF